MIAVNPRARFSPKCAPSFPFSTAESSQSNHRIRCTHLHESHRILRDTLSGWRIQALVPGYDRPVPPGTKDIAPKASHKITLRGSTRRNRLYWSLLGQDHVPDGTRCRLVSRVRPETLVESQQRQPTERGKITRLLDRRCGRSVASCT